MKKFAKLMGVVSGIIAIIAIAKKVLTVNILCFYFSSFLKNRQAFLAWRFFISKSMSSTPGFILRVRIF